MLTTIEQVREWITDNGFKRWILYRDYGRTEKILDSAGFNSEMPDKLAMTEKYLRLSGGHAYAAAGTTNAANDLTTIAEIQLATETQQSAQGVGFAQQQYDEAAMEKRIEGRIRAEFERKEYEKLRKDLDEERKRFEDEKASAIGALVHYFAPIGQALFGQRRMVAGVDAEEPVHADPIIPNGSAQEKAEEQEQEIFTDEESDELFDLMARFKKVEPENYLKLLKRMVEMAESGDATYTMAKGFLLK